MKEQYAMNSVVSVLFCLSSVYSLDAFAGSVSADTSSRWTSVAAKGTGTSAFFAHCEKTGPVPAGPNQTSRLYKQGIGVVTEVANPIPPSPGVAIVVGRSTYAPTVGKDMEPKIAAPYNFENGSAHCGPEGSRVSGGGNYGRNPRPVVDAYGFASGGSRGTGAGATFDPISLYSGIYPYDQSAAFIIERESENDFGGVKFVATDSRINGDDVLWTLEVWADSRVDTPEDVHIVFALAENDFLFGPDGNPIESGSIEQTIRQSLVISGGVIRLDVDNIFPDGSTIVVDVDDREAGWGSEAALTQLGISPED
jgi:hypothetical protein